ncbi:ribonuclease H-like domain-containing protein [Mycena belliarum]|uniref:Ribonuclease H-like domain-containing protein n=1 Tax=Mycena belliarum TaxID=1033014 RepID=A0AAD6XP85_9AGAR|nr:ribonuclease H-like domain-containing protein [Mycena belliae]
MVKHRAARNTTIHLDFTVCNTEDTLAAAIQALQGSRTIFLDCEGEKLGLKGGCLSLISLGMPVPDAEQPRIYIIDALVLTVRTLRPIFAILETPDITKIVFDGRMDHTALFFRKNTKLRMQNVVDLQLAEVKSRARRGEGWMAQRTRLSPYLPANEVKRHVALYEEVHKLAGLEQVVREHQVDVPQEQLTAKANFTHKNWIKRPLSRTYLQYAATDIALIARLRAKFSAEGYLADAGVLAAQSLRYVNMWTHGPQPLLGDVYKLHALLPLGILILDDVTDEAGKYCAGCGRTLAQDCFSASAWKRARGRSCLVCRAIGVRLEWKDAFRRAVGKSR